MTWNYSGNPASSDLDEVRYLVGDTDSTDPLVQDEEINYAIGKQSTLELAAAQVLRALAAKYSRWSNYSVGEVSVSDVAAIAKAFKERADELDPMGLTLGDSALCAPSFGGLTITGKESLDEDTDAVQPMFKKGADDYPGGPDVNG
jgi:hypothetical protein